MKISLNFPAQVLINELEKLIEKHGKPKGIRTDNVRNFGQNDFKFSCLKILLCISEYKKATRSKMLLSNDLKKLSEMIF